MDKGGEYYSRYLDGDDEGLVLIVRDYKDGLILYLYGICKNIHTAEDLCEDTFVRLVTKRPKYTGKASFKTWLYTIGRNAAYDELRRSRAEIPRCAVLSDFSNRISARLCGLRISRI